MERFLKLFIKPDFFERKTVVNEENISEEIKLLREEINCTRSYFENECDEDLIEACVYQLESLEARYRFLIKRAKQLNCTEVLETA